MIDQIVLDGGLGEVRVALLTRGRLVELHYFRDDDPPPVGSVYLARVSRIAPGHHGAFLDLDGRTQGFLKVRKTEPMPVEGAAVPVAIRAAATTEKLAICTTVLPAGSPPIPGGCEAPALAHAPTPPWRPLLAAHPEAAIITDHHDLAAQAKAVLAKPALVTVRRGALFEELGLEAEIAHIIAGNFPLPHGAVLRQTNSPALTAWDVDLGGADVKGGKAAHHVNMAAALELARQARLQHLGGLMVIDFLKTGRNDLAQACTALQTALANDPTPTEVGPVSRFGLVELSRRRAGRPLREILIHPPTLVMNPSTAGHALLRAALRAQLLDPGGFPVLRVSPMLAAWLNTGPLARLGAQTGRPAELEMDPGRALDAWEVYTRRP